MKIIAFGASYSKQSINKQFAAHATQHFAHAEIEVLD
jgi:NAD(P)H-dependent FMN reductase